MCFNWYKNRKLKVKLSWVGTRERKNRALFVSFILYRLFHALFLLVFKIVESLQYILKVSEYPFKQNKNTLKNLKVPLYTHFCNIFLNVLRPTFFNICNLPVSQFPPNIRKIRVKVGPQTNYFSYFMSPCTGRIVVFNNFFSLIFSRPRDKQNRAPDFLFSKYFLNNLLYAKYALKARRIIATKND